MSGGGGRPSVQQYSIMNLSSTIVLHTANFFIIALLRFAAVKLSVLPRYLLLF